MVSKIRICMDKSVHLATLVQRKNYRQVFSRLDIPLAYALFPQAMNFLILEKFREII